MTLHPGRLACFGSHSGALRAPATGPDRDSLCGDGPSHGLLAHAEPHSDLQQRETRLVESGCLGNEKPIEPVLTNRNRAANQVRCDGAAVDAELTAQLS